MSKLTELIRKKHPGAYDDLNDADLEAKVLAKYPEYKDLAVPSESDISPEKFRYSTPELNPDFQGPIQDDPSLTGPLPKPIVPNKPGIMARVGGAIDDISKRVAKNPVNTYLNKAVEKIDPGGANRPIIGPNPIDLDALEAGWNKATKFKESILPSYKPSVYTKEEKNAPPAGLEKLPYGIGDYLVKRRPEIGQVEEVQGPGYQQFPGTQRLANWVREKGTATGSYGLGFLSDIASQGIEMAGMGFDPRTAGIARGPHIGEVIDAPKPTSVRPNAPSDIIDIPAKRGNLLTGSTRGEYDAVSQKHNVPYNPFEKMTDTEVMRMRDSLPQEANSELQRRGINPREVPRDIPPERESVPITSDFTPQQMAREKSIDPFQHLTDADVLGLPKGNLDVIAEMQKRGIQPQTDVPVTTTRDYQPADYAMDNAYTRARGGEPSPSQLELAGEKPANVLNAPPSELEQMFGIELDPDAKFEQQLREMERNQPPIEQMHDIGPNASGESAASAEAISRQSGMKSKGEQYVVYDRAGNERPLIGPEAVDYQARPGETYGIKGPEGFRTLEDKGGKVATLKVPKLTDIANQVAGTERPMDRAPRGFKDQAAAAEFNKKMTEIESRLSPETKARNAREEAIRKREEADGFLHDDERDKPEEPQFSKKYDKKAEQRLKELMKTKFQDKTDAEKQELSDLLEARNSDSSEQKLEELYNKTVEKRLKELQSKKWKDLTEEEQQEAIELLDASDPDWRKYQFYDNIDKPAQLDATGRKRLQELQGNDFRTQAENRELYELSSLDKPLESPEQTIETDPRRKTEAKALSHMSDSKYHPSNFDPTGGEPAKFTKSNTDPRWVEAKVDADKLGIDANDYENIEDLEWAITKKTAQETVRTGRNPLHEKPEGPLHARVTKGGVEGVKIGVNTKRAASEVTTGYSQPLEAIMIREGGQNGIDAVRRLGASGKISITIHDKYMEISDNGKGMTRKELQKEFSDLHDTGKETEAGATGGKGIGKASYMLGGKHFSVETVVLERGDTKVKRSMSGTPEEFAEFAPIKEEVVDFNTPTGTKIRTEFAPGQYASSARGMLDKIVGYSRGIEAKLIINKHGTMGGEMGTIFKSARDDKQITKTNIDGNGITVSIPQGERLDKRGGMDVYYLNNGMFQFTKYHYLKEETPNMPSKLLVDIRPTAIEGTGEYPFPTARESIKDKLHEAIEKLINEKLAAPEAAARKNVLQQLYDSMTEFPTNTIRKGVMFDPGDRLTKTERRQYEDSPTINNLIGHFDETIDHILDKVDRPEWTKKLEGVGIVLDPNMYGVHIPNPSSQKSTILINIFAHAENNTPANAAFKTVVTMLHEVAHIYKGPSEIYNAAVTSEGLTGDRVAKYLQSYMDQMQTHGDTDIGHTMPFVKRLGETYARFGPENAFNAADSLEKIITDSTGNYSPEFQELLQIYTDSRGRPETTTDFLSGTGTKSRNDKGGKGNIPSNDKTTGEGTTGSENYPLGDTGYPIGHTIIMKAKTPQQVAGNVKKARNLGFEYQGRTKDGNMRFKKVREPGDKRPMMESDVPEKPMKNESKGPEKLSTARQIYELPRALMAVDLPYITSAGFRQALPMIGTGNWFRAWATAAKAYHSQDIYNSIMERINNHPLVRPRVGADGKKLPSFIDEIGLRTTDLVSGLSKREEFQRSEWAEKFLWKYGSVHVAGSNRAYTAFLNDLRISMLEDFIEMAQAQGRDPFKDKPLAKDIAEFINDATGRGSLKTSIGIGKKFQLELNLEKGAKILSDALFSPRLFAARARLLNIQTYIMADPFVRRRYMWAMLRMIGGWWAMAGLASLVTGVKVSTDPNNADFGKIRIGNTRIDPGGGLQQFLVLDHRMLPSARSWEYLGMPHYVSRSKYVKGGGISSSVTGRYRPFGQGYKPDTRGSTALEFGSNKLHPWIKLFWDVMWAQGRRPVQLGDRIMQMWMPMVAGDISQLVREHPWLAAMVGLASTSGMGTQTYEGGMSDPVYIPKKYDITVGGGE
jgi:hypothetical protein